MSPIPVVILTGPPGAGKTTVAKMVAGTYDQAVVIEADWFWTTIRRGFIPPWQEAAHAQNQTVLRSVFAAARQMLTGGYAVVIEGIVGPWYLDLLRQQLRGISVRYLVLRPDLSTCLDRAASRAGDERVEGHPPLTDEGPIRQLWHQFSDLGPYERHVIDTTGLSVSATVAAVGEGLGDDHLVLAGDAEPAVTVEDR